MDGQGTSSRVRTRKGKGVMVPRRFWTAKEEEALVIALEVLRSEGWKLDGSFRGGYMGRLENMITERLPGCGILAKHVKSKLTVWKKTHTAIVTLLNCSGSAGFSMDPTTNMVMEEKPDAWSEYKKVHPEGVKLVRGKSFPWYPRWNTIFTNDRATGQHSVDIGDAVQELFNGVAENERGRTTNTIGSSNVPLTDEMNLDDEDEATSLTPPSVECTQQKNGSSTKKRLKTDDPAEIKIMMSDWMESTRTAIGDVALKLFPASTACSLDIPPDDSTKRAGLFNALSVIPGLSIDDQMEAVHHLAHNKEDLDAFWGMPEDVRGRYVVRILNGKF